MSANIMAGLLAGSLLAVVLVIYLLLRGRALAAFFQDLDPAMGKLSQGALLGMLYGGFILAAFAFGVLAGVVYGLLGAPAWFAALGIGLALLFSILALTSKTPLAGDKIAWNFAFGLTLGLLVPVFAPMLG